MNQKSAPCSDPHTDGYLWQGCFNGSHVYPGPKQRFLTIYKVDRYVAYKAI